MDQDNYTPGAIVSVHWQDPFEGRILDVKNNGWGEPCAIIALEDVPDDQRDGADVLQTVSGEDGIMFAFSFLGKVISETWTCPGCERYLPAKDKVDYLCRRCRGL